MPLGRPGRQMLMLMLLQSDHSVGSRSSRVGCFCSLVSVYGSLCVCTCSVHVSGALTLKLYVRRSERLCASGSTCCARCCVSLALATRQLFLAWNFKASSGVNRERRCKSRACCVSDRSRASFSTLSAIAPNLRSRRNGR